MSILIVLLCISNFLLIESFSYNNGRRLTTLKQLKMTASENDSKLYTSVGATGLVANAVCDYSLYVLKTTGCGLPAGPFGLIGAAEGVSYLTVVGILGWSLFTKVKTGSGSTITHHSTLFTTDIILQNKVYLLDLVESWVLLKG